MKLIGTGRESKAFLIDNESVILIGQNKTAFSNYKNQKIILDILQDKIDFVKIPQNATLISPCEEYPYGALDISYVEGITPELNILNTQEKLKLGKQIAQFIYKFQIIGEQLNKYEKKLINSIELKTDAKAVNFCLKLVKKYLTEEQFKKLCQIAKIYKSKYKKSKKILHHGDLNLSNLKIDDNKNLIGIIDFECVGFYIPEYKIKNQWHDEIIYKSVLEEYYKLSGYLINDRKFSEVCEIITMILHLNRFYSLGKEQIELRVNIIQDLIDKF